MSNYTLKRWDSSEEGTLFTRSVSFADPGADVWTGTVNFGDGSSLLDLSGLAPGTPFALEHLYGNNGTFVVTLTVQDGDGGVTSDSFTLTVTNALPAVDAGPDLSVPEGALVSLTALTTDAGFFDRHTFQWSVLATNGQVIPTGSNPDFNFTPADEGTYTVTVVVTDNNGGIGFDSVEVTVTNVAPVGALDGPAMVDEGLAYTLLLGPRMDPGTDTVTQYRVDWGDGTPLELFTPAQLTALNRTLTHTFANQSTAVITVAMVDEDGVHTSSGVKFVTVRNVAPVLSVLAGSTAVLSENNLLTLTGSIADPGVMDFQTVTIDWGDGTTPQNLVLPVGLNQFSVDHRYLDDHPSGTLSDTFTIAVRVNDGQSDSPIRTMRVGVDNTAPAFSGLTVSATTLVENQSVNLSGTLIDPGTLDTHTVTVDWGDGSAVQSLALNAAQAFSGSHLYALPGSYTLLLTASDDDGGVLTIARNVAVDDLPPEVVASNFGSVGAGALFVRSGSFTDASGPEDAWTATVGFDGGPALPLALNPDKTFLIQHVFTTVGAHSVTVIVSDRFGRSGEQTFAVNVQPTGSGPVVLGFEVNDGQFQCSRLAGVSVLFSKNVGASLSAADVTLRNLTTATNVAAASLALDFNPTTNTWTIGLAAGVILPAGNYQLTVLAAGILDNGGQPLAANTVVDFHILPGDANGDRTVNDRDLFLAWQNTFLPPANQNANADLTGDGFVDAADLLVIRSHYLATLSSVSLQELNGTGDGALTSFNLVSAQAGSKSVAGLMAPRKEIRSTGSVEDRAGAAIRRMEEIRFGLLFPRPGPWHAIPRWFQKPGLDFASLWRNDNEDGDSRKTSIGQENWH